MDIKEYGYFNKDKDYIMFLEKYDNDTPYSTLSPFQGHLNVEGSYIIPNKGNDIHNKTPENKVINSNEKNVKLDKNTFITNLKIKVK